MPTFYGVVSQVTDYSTLYNNLVAYYKFDANAYDSTGNGHNATVTGATLTTGNGGQINECYEFDGVNDYIRVTGLPTLNDFTYSLWINPDSISGQQYFLTADYNTANSLIFFFNAALSPNYRILVDGVVHASDDEVTTGWKHIVLQREGTVVRLYENAILIHTFTGVSSDALPGVLDLGYAPTRALAGVYFDGKIDEVGVWSRAITSIEVSKLYNSGVGKQLI